MTEQLGAQIHTNFNWPLACPLAFFLKLKAFIFKVLAEAFLINRKMMVNIMLRPLSSLLFLSLTFSCLSMNEVFISLR